MSEAAAGSQQPQSKRQRAFLGPLPDDFLRVDSPSSAHAYPSQGQQSTQGIQRDGRLVPMTYTPQAAQQHRHDSFMGKLKVTIAQAKMTKNYGLTRMDPYCRVRIGHSVYETPTDVNGSKNPRWNKVFSCNLPRGITSMYVEIFNERYLALDDRVAWAYYELTEELLSGESVEEWIPLSGKQGEGLEGNINIILSFHKSTNYHLSAYGNQPIAMVPTAVPADPQQMYYGGYGMGYPPQQQGYPPQQQGYPPQQQGYPPQQQGYAPQTQPQPTQQTPPQRPKVREEDVKQLVEMFPGLEKDVIHSVLEASHGRVDTAVTSLLQMADS